MCLVPVCVFGRSYLCLVMSCLCSLCVCCHVLELKITFGPNHYNHGKQCISLKEDSLGVCCSGIRLNRWRDIVNHLWIFNNLFLNEPNTLTHK